MITSQIIQTSIDELKAITKVDLGVYDLNGSEVASTMERDDITTDLITGFAASPADSQVIGVHHLLKIRDEGELLYVLVARGMTDDVYMVGKIAVSQIQNLVIAYKERFDRNNFFQNLLLDNLQAMADYKRLGYSDNWINQRLKSIEIRKDLTDEWKKRGLEEGLHFATLTDIIYKSWSDMTSKEYKRLKGLRKENLRDNMTNKELVLNMLAELSTKEISETSEPETFSEHINVAQQGGEVARNARLELEAKTGKSVISPLNAQKIISLKKGENERDV